MYFTEYAITIYRRQGMKTVIKRDGSQVSFNGGKIKTAIENAMMETKAGVDSALAGEIAAAI
jgi:anaerobic ribonucleoside-triphosphate reductase